jgi:hypothetical protein
VRGAGTIARTVRGNGLRFFGQCSVCQDIERKFFFGRGSSETPEPPPVRALPQEPVASIPTHEGFASTWTRAVKKLRNHQADIRVRAWDEKNDSNDNQTREKLAAARKPRTTEDATSQKPNLARKSARALRVELLRGLPCVRNRTQQLILEPAFEEIQRFNRFWDSLVLTRQHSDLLAQAPPPYWRGRCDDP